MRIVKITNIVAASAFVILWILLFFTKESYMGSGLNYPANFDSTALHFTPKNPYTFTYNGKLFGFRNEITSNKDTIITGLWNLDTDSNLVHYTPFPDGKIDKIESLSINPDSQLIIVGSKNDTSFSIIIFDSTVHKTYSIHAPAEFLGMGYHKGKTELVFGRNGKILGHIFTLADSVKMRTYDLPNFYNRICEIIQVFVEDDTWKFLTQTNYHRRNEVWIILDTTRKSNYLIWDERGVYPEYPGILSVHHDTALEIMDYSLSNKIPNLPQHDSVLQFENRKLTLNKPVPHKKVYFGHATIKIDGTIWDITSYDTSQTQSGFLTRNQYLSNPSFNLPYELDDSSFHFLMPESNSKQIFFDTDEYPAALLGLPEGGHLLISSKLNYSFLNSEGISIQRKNFFSTLHSSIRRIYPENRNILEVEVPEFGALRYFFMLYGLLPLWLISLIVNWLIQVLKKKPKFSVRDNNLPYSLRLLPGSVIFIVFFALSIVKMLNDFSII